jgi:uncharacterized Zn finger protein (UPF0148 family)
MDVTKYNRQITLLCPTCGCTQFESEDESEIVKCASCGRHVTKEELIEENNENISNHVEEIGKKITTDLADELMKAFSGSKFVRIR